MPHTDGEPLDLETSTELSESIKEMQINQTLTGLKLMPQLLPKVQAWAARGDLVMLEVLKRYNQNNK